MCAKGVRAEIVMGITADDENRLMEEEEVALAVPESVGHLGRATVNIHDRGLLFDMMTKEVIQSIMNQDPAAGVEEV